MNRTNFEHLGVGLALQGLIWLLTGNLWLGALFVTGLFLGREHAQREYHLGDPSRLIGYEALDFWRWTPDEVFDLLFPSGAVLMVAFVAHRVW